jgi:hypothetical protein
VEGVSRGELIEEEGDSNKEGVMEEEGFGFEFDEKIAALGHPNYLFGVVYDGETQVRRDLSFKDSEGRPASKKIKECFYYFLEKLELGKWVGVGQPSHIGPRCIPRSHYHHLLILVAKALSRGEELVCPKEKSLLSWLATQSTFYNVLFSMLSNVYTFEKEFDLLGPFAFSTHFGYPELIKSFELTEQRAFEGSQVVRQLAKEFAFCRALGKTGLANDRVYPPKALHQLTSLMRAYRLIETLDSFKDTPDYLSVLEKRATATAPRGPSFLNIPAAFFTCYYEKSSSILHDWLRLAQLYFLDPTFVATLLRLLQLMQPILELDAKLLALNLVFYGWMGLITHCEPEEQNPQLAEYLATQCLSLFDDSFHPNLSQKDKLNIVAVYFSTITYKQNHRYSLGSKTPSEVMILNKNPFFLEDDLLRLPPYVSSCAGIIPLLKRLADEFAPGTRAASNPRERPARRASLLQCHRRGLCPPAAVQPYPREPRGLHDAELSRLDSGPAARVDRVPLPHPP